MKRSIIKTVIFGLVFLVGLVVFGVLTNRGNMDMTAKMEEATLPLVSVKLEGRSVNYLSGYKNAMQTAYVQDCITALSKERMIEITIQENGVKIDNVGYELRSVDGQRLIENNETADYEKKDGVFQAKLKFKDLLEENTEYMLVLLLTTQEEDVLHYYTKIIICENSHIAESMDFVMDFHNRTYDKEAAKEITRYLESDSSGNNSDFYNVDIHSSFDQVTWGSLDVLEEMAPTMKITEINGAVSSYKLDYVVSDKGEEHQNFYRVSEYYRVKYTDTRMYLLEYERKMEKIFQPDSQNYDSTKIILGIGSTDIDLSESDDGKNLAFVTADRLFAFNITDEKMSLLFSFYDPENLKIQDLNNSHDIRILNIDETGNITFMVYGYMNRGEHEGEVGIVVYTYNSLNSVVSEQVYIPYEKSYDILKSDVEKLAYINRNNKLYLSLENAIYEINITESACKILSTEEETGEYKISESGRMVVWQKGNGDEYHGEKLYLMDLSTEEISEIVAEKGSYVKALGFIGEDLVYGFAASEDVVKNENDETAFYMNFVQIQNESGILLKSYQQEGVYVSSVEIEDTMLHLSRAEKKVSETDTIFSKIEDDQIVSAKEGISGKNYVETGYSNLYKSFVRIVLNGKITPKNVHFTEPEQELYEGEKNLEISFDNGAERFYVYNAKEFLGTFDKAAEAVEFASKNSAWVINDYGNYVWRRENRKNKNQIMAIREVSVTEDKNALSVCLDTILSYEGIMRNSAYLLEQGNSITEILSQNLESVQVLELTECTLDAVLYYVNMDIPVMVRTGYEKAVLITGFNDSEVVILDPEAGTLSKVKKKKAEEDFKALGSHYITYVYTG